MNIYPNTNPPPQLNGAGGFGNEIGPRAQTLCTRPDQVINQLSKRLSKTELKLVEAQLRGEELVALLRRCERQIELCPLNFEVIELLNDLERELK